MPNCSNLFCDRLNFSYFFQETWSLNFLLRSGHQSTIRITNHSQFPETTISPHSLDFSSLGNIPCSSKLIMEYKRYVQRDDQYLDFLDSDEREVFMIVFDVSCLKEEELYIEVSEENKLVVNLKHGFRETGDITFSRDCKYVYTLPENVQTAKLAAYWYENDFLVIKEKKTRETEMASEFRKDPDGHEFKSDGILNFSTAANKNKARENIKLETPSTESSEQNIILERHFMSSGSESEDIVTKENKSLSTSSKSLEKSIEDRESISTSSETGEKTQESKWIDHTSTIQAISRLVPIRKVHNQFNRMLTESDLQAAMNDIEKRINLVNVFIDKHSFESLH